MHTHVFKGRYNNYGNLQSHIALVFYIDQSSVAKHGGPMTHRP